MISCSRTHHPLYCVQKHMLDAFERFFNWQSDGDWFWGPLLHLRPPRNVRMTRRFWLKMIGIVAFYAVPGEAVLVSLLAYYDYATAQHHDTKIPPVAVAENWITTASPQAVLSSSALLIAFCILWCVCQHWAWNRRADRLNREPILLEPVVTNSPGVWPPPPRTMP